MHFYSRALTRLDPNITRLKWRRGRAGASPPPGAWLAVEQFEYDRVHDQLGVLQLLAKLDREFGAPAGALLIVQNDSLTRVHTPLASSTSWPQASGAHAESHSALVWRASFVVPLAVVEYPQAAFSLTANDHVAIALPAPLLTSAQTPARGRCVRFTGARARRHVAALTAGLAIAMAPGWAVGVAGAATVSHASSQQHARHRSASPRSPAATQPATTSAPANNQSAAPTRAPDPTHHAGTREHIHHDYRHHQLHANAPRTHDKGARHDTSKPDADRDHAGQSHPAHPRQAPAWGVAWADLTGLDRSREHGHHDNESHRHHRLHADAPRTQHKRAHHDRSTPGTHRDHRGHHPRSHQKSHVRGAAALPAPLTPAPAPAAASQPTAPVAPATTGNSANTTTLAAWLGLPSATAAWPAGLNRDLFTAAELGQTSSLLTPDNRTPAYLIPIYKAAARRYRVPWQILAAINWIETDYGRDLNTSSAGAIGWMQFMPGTWQEYGIAADGNRQPNPYSPKDAIFAAARYLAANGAAHNLPKAIYAYNHAVWYVAEVLWRAQIISDHSRVRTDSSLAGTGRTGLAGAETLLVAAFSAVGGPYSQANHDSFGRSAAELRQTGTDCSGFVSWVLDQVDRGFGNQTTVTLPDQPRIHPGVGQYVTMWDRPLPGDQGHVIINILGTWFESGGNSADNPSGGISPMSEAQAVGELSGGGFLPYHLKGL